MFVLSLSKPILSCFSLSEHYVCPTVWLPLPSARDGSWDQLSHE